VELPPGVKKIALTFDLCEQPYEVAGYDSSIVDFLRTAQVKATFFGGGKWIVSHERRARQLIADPLFEMGNHTWEHRNLRLLSDTSLRNEIAGAQVAYSKVYQALVRDKCLVPDRQAKVIGLPTSPGEPWLFRFPFGACNPESLRAVGDAGLLAIQWDVSSGDPLKGLSATRMASSVLQSVRPGSIVLFHANGRGWQTAEALRIIVPELRNKMKYELVTVTELLNTEGARRDIAPTCYDNRPGDTDRYDAFARRLEVAYQKFRDGIGPACMRRSEEGYPSLKEIPRPKPVLRKNDPANQDLGKSGSLSR
jgi:peptidoglycan/xylan/chitin deacetylase (PgdA/CDA1 family)